MIILTDFDNEQDFDQLPHGPNTLVGDQGVMLSGVNRNLFSKYMNCCLGTKSAC